MASTVYLSRIVGENLPAFAVGLGLFSHVWFKQQEPTAPGFILWVSFLSLFFTFCANNGFDWSTNPLKLQILPAVVAMSLYIFTLSSSITIYRLYLNPLKRFPGDILPALTKWHAFVIASRGDTHHYMLKQHQKHGYYVRIGPNEISISDPAYISIIHGNKSRFPKGPWYDNQLPNQPASLIAIRPYDEHKAHRKIWDETLTPKALKVYESRISILLNDLEGRFTEFAKKGESLDLPIWIEHLLFDAIGKIAFNVNFHSIEKGTAHFYVDFIHSTLSFVASFANISWIKPILAVLPTDKKTMQDMAKFISFSQAQLTDRIQAQGAAEIDALGFLMAAGDRNPAYKLSIPQLASETTLIIAAGSDTTSIAILSAMYWLINDKTAYQKLRLECLNIFGPDEDFDAAKLGDLKRAPYLNACINEALRLLPPGPNGMQRVVNTAGGIFVNNIHVPEGTKINVHPWTMHHDARSFEKPWDFIPERWIERSGFQGAHNPAASIPFALGAYSCIGKNLALMQIRMFLVKIIPKFDFEIAPGFDKRSFIENTKAFFGLRKEPLEVFATVHAR